jgi:hypothetical protein
VCSAKSETKITTRKVLPSSPNFSHQKKKGEVGGREVKGGGRRREGKGGRWEGGGEREGALKYGGGARPGKLSVVDRFFMHI